MNPFKLLIFIILLPASLLAQREVYVTDRQETISKEEYDKEETEEYFYLDFETEELIVHVKARREIKGQLEPLTLKKLRANLYDSIQKPLNQKATMVIIYSPGMDQCLKTGSWSSVKAAHKLLNNTIAELDNTDAFYVYDDPSANKAYGKKIKWIPDTNQTFKELFFPIHFPCGSFVMIDSQGNYCAYRGEYAMDHIYERLEDKESTFSGAMN